MSAPTIPPAATGDEPDNTAKAEVLRAEIAREAALGSDGQVSALSLALQLVTNPELPVSTTEDYPDWPLGGAK